MDSIGQMMGSSQVITRDDDSVWENGSSADLASPIGYLASPVRTGPNGRRSHCRTVSSLSHFSEASPQSMDGTFQWSAGESVCPLPTSPGPVLQAAAVSMSDLLCLSQQKTVLAARLQGPSPP